MTFSSVLRLSVVFLSLAGAKVQADTFTANPNAADGSVRRDANGTVTVIPAGTALGTDDYQSRIGEYFAPGGICYVIPFQIPTLANGQVFSSISLQLQLSDKGATDANADLYAVRINASPTLLTSDYYQGASADPNATLLQSGILTNVTPVRVDANNGFVTSSAAANSSFASFLNKADINNSLAGQYVFLRISYAIDTIPNGNNYYAILTDNAGGTNEKPLLTYTTAAGNAVPEPSTCCLTALLGLGMFALRRRVGA